MIGQKIRILVGFGCEQDTFLYILKKITGRNSECHWCKSCNNLRTCDFIVGFDNT